MDNTTYSNNQPNTQTTASTEAVLPEFIWIDKMSNILDNQFKIPFTNTRFGVDFLIGLIPTVGDWLSFGISSVLVFAMIRRGVGLGMMLKMMWNITIDALIGSIPLLGDWFDLKHKANRRNVQLLKQYYIENPNPPSAKRSFFIIGLFFLIFVIGILWLSFKLLAWLWIMAKTSF